LIELVNVSVVLSGQKILDNISFKIQSPEVLAIIGPSGSGKTSLAQVIAGSLFHSGTVNFVGFPSPLVIEFVSQQHGFKDLFNTSQFYYQQRYNATESDQSLTVADVMSIDNEWIDLLHLRDVLERPLLQLSNGENKRVQLAQKLESTPQVLILDNPFLGLDVDGRVVLETILVSLINQGVQIILVTAMRDLPEFVTHVAELSNGGCRFFGPKHDMVRHTTPPGVFAQEDSLRAIQLVQAPAGQSFDFAVRLVSVNIRYDEKVVLKSVSWEVARGECWSLSGPNGAGKSTLLSLITGDNPQAYANEIYLFDRRRGTGESIWDIKRRIGFVSPELHLYFDQGSSCYEVIASGLFDTIGLFRVLNEEQRNLVRLWVNILQLEASVDKPLRLLSRGQQRLALLGRALVKSPPLLVLDEPCQGLDSDQAGSFLALVSAVCRQFGSTLIYVTHYAQEVPDCVTKHFRLENGQQVPA
jgi:molybdate transport system ATP-binding protein